MKIEQGMAVAVAIVFAVIIIASIAFQRSIWNECREINSFGYCWVMMSGKR
jgi:hypothetical protein